MAAGEAAGERLHGSLFMFTVYLSMFICISICGFFESGLQLDLYVNLLLAA